MMKKKTRRRRREGEGGGAEAAETTTTAPSQTLTAMTSSPEKCLEQLMGLISVCRCAALICCACAVTSAALPHQLIAVTVPLAPSCRFCRLSSSSHSDIQIPTLSLPSLSLSFSLRLLFHPRSLTVSTFFHTLSLSLFCFGSLALFHFCSRSLFRFCLLPSLTLVRFRSFTFSPFVL